MQVVDYKAPIRGIAKLILSLLTQLAAMFAKQIKDMELRLMAVGILESAGQAVDVLSDANPDDKEQLRQIINALINKPEFSNSAKAEIMGKISTLSNEQVRIALSVVNDNVFPVADLLTDDDKDNTEQIREHLATVLQSPEGITFFNSLLGIILPPVYANTLTLVIVQALIAFLEQDEDGDEEKAAKVHTLRQMAQGYTIAA
jgi:hypothetical protein